MTFTIKSTIVNGYLIELNQWKFENSYHVIICPKRQEGVYGYPVSDLIYTDIRKAQRRFNNAVRYYSNTPN